MFAFDFQKRCKGNDYFLSCKSLEIFFQFFFSGEGKVGWLNHLFAEVVGWWGYHFCAFNAHPPAPLGAPLAPRCPDFLRLCHTEVANVLSSLAEHLSLFAARLFRGHFWPSLQKCILPSSHIFPLRNPEKNAPPATTAGGGALFANQLARIDSTHLVWW